MDGLSEDPLLPHLVELASQPESRGTILSGGFGIRLKQAHRKASGVQTLLEELPEVRATQDLDFFLSLRFWIENDREEAIDYRAMLGRLGYEVVQHSWQFKKPLLGVPSRSVRLDLHARSPSPGEAVNVRDRPPQVGKGMGTDLAGLRTPEGFAIDDSPTELRVEFGEMAAPILVPHPYAWLSLKVRAAFDWLSERRGGIAPKLNAVTGDSLRLKHVYDVYVLTAMLTETERQETELLAKRYAEHDTAREIREQATELYGMPDAEGIQAAKTYVRQSFGSDLMIDHDLFWNEGLRVALGL